MRRLRDSVNFANVMTTIAVFLAMGGAALATTKIAKNSVNSPKIKNGAVKGKDVKDDSLTGADIDETSLALRADGGPSGPAGGDLTGQYPDPALSRAAVGTGELADGAVTSTKIANNTVGSAKLTDGTVGTADLADNAVTTNKISAGSVTGEDISGNAVGASALADIHFYQVTTSIPSQSSRNVHVQCGGSYEIAISGGGYYTDANDSYVNLWVMGSAPSYYGDAWNVRAVNPGLSARNFTAVVQCLPA